MPNRGERRRLLPELEDDPGTVLATVLFTDIVGSAATAATLGDRGWRELLERHHEVVRRWRLFAVERDAS